ncbi:MAG: VanZ family protein [Ruminococcaceae bacterium]|nr:VanZ family protein [Oscillospiraceae bacterium]
MIQIPYGTMVLSISILWLILRAAVCTRMRRISWRRELQLLLVYICLIVITRFTFCPFGKVDGQIQPLLFDRNRIFPPRINLLPLVYLADYPDPREALLNFIGNTAMFIPVGIVWPAVFRELRRAAAGIAAGVGFSFCIEILQLPFFDRVSDIDDLLLNSLGYVIGYGLFLLVKKLCGTAHTNRV